MTVSASWAFSALTSREYRKGFAYGFASDTAPISDLEFPGATSVASRFCVGRSAFLPQQPGTAVEETDAMTKLTPEQRTAIAERLAEIVAKLAVQRPHLDLAMGQAVSRKA